MVAHKVRLSILVSAPIAVHATGVWVNGREGRFNKLEVRFSKWTDGGRDEGLRKSGLCRAISVTSGPCILDPVLRDVKKRVQCRIHPKCEVTGGINQNF